MASEMQFLLGELDSYVFEHEDLKHISFWDLKQCISQAMDKYNQQEILRLQQLEAMEK